MEIFKSKSRNLLRIFLFIISLIILFFILRNIGFDKLELAFVKVGFGGLLILICCRFVENGSDAYGLFLSLPKRKSFLKIFAANCLGTLTNYLIPWEAGELVKIGVIKGEGGSENAIKGVILWNCVFKLSKGFALLSMVIFSLLFSFFVADASYQLDKFWLMLFCSILGFLPSFGIMILIHSNMSVKIVKLLKFLGKKNTDELIKKAERMDHDLKLFRKERPSDYKKTFWLQFLARYVSLLTFVLCTHFAGFSDYTVSVLMLTYCAVNLGDYISAFIPVKLGVGEGFGFLIFAFMGLSGDAGGLITFILRVQAVIAMSMVSLLIFVPSEKIEGELTK